MIKIRKEKTIQIECKNEFVFGKIIWFYMKLGYKIEGEIHFDDGFIAQLSKYY